MKPAFIRLLLNHEFWVQNKSKLAPEMFVEDAKLIYETLKWAHEEFKRDLSVEEIHDLTKSRNPTLTRAQRTTLASFIEDVEEATGIKADTGAFLLKEAWRKEVGRKIAEIGIELDEGSQTDLSAVREVLSKHEDDFIPTDKINEVTTNVKDVLKALKNRKHWKFNIESLNEQVPGIAEGEFAYILARPDVGKTLFTVNMIAGPNGFADQGARVLYLGNEEPVIRTVMRCINSFTGMTTDEVDEDPDKAAELFAKIENNITFIDEVGFTIDRLHALCRKRGFDIIVIDQLDKLSVSGRFESTHEQLGELYCKAREVAKLNKCSLIGVTQASADADGKTLVTYSMSAGSKTSKAAESDLILGLGMEELADPNSERRFIRYCNVSKNKLSSFHGPVIYKIDPKVSRCYS